jgi:hypothetical protein
MIPFPVAWSKTAMTRSLSHCWSKTMTIDKHIYIVPSYLITGGDTIAQFYKRFECPGIKVRKSESGFHWHAILFECEFIVNLSSDFRHEASVFWQTPLPNTTTLRLLETLEQVRIIVFKVFVIGIVVNLD